MTNRAAPDLSVLMCVKDGAQDLHTALDSLERQTTDQFEVVVVDDGSADESRSIAAGHPVVSRVVDGPGIGLAMARNTGLRTVDGRYVTFLDHDDLFHPSRVERIRDAIAAFPDDPWLWTGHRNFATSEGPGVSDVVVLDSKWPHVLVRRGRELDVLTGAHCPIDVTGSNSTTVRSHEQVMSWGGAGAPLIARVDLLREAGGFPTHLGPAEDVLMMMNIARRAPIREIDQPTYFYRLRADSETRSMGLPWSYLSAVTAARFGGQHMTADRALGRGAPLPRDLVLEDLLARSIARDGFDGAAPALFHMVCLVYPDRADRRAMFRRIAVDLLRTRNPGLDRRLRRIRSMLRRDESLARVPGEGGPGR